MFPSNSSVIVHFCSPTNFVFLTQVIILPTLYLIQTLLKAFGATKMEIGLVKVDASLSLRPRERKVERIISPFCIVH